MSSRIRMWRGARSAAESAKRALGDERIHVNLTIRRQVWTLAKQRFPNVSRLVEQLLLMALGLESSVEIVRFGDLACRGSLAREGGGLEIHWAFARQGSNPCPGAINAECSTLLFCYLYSYKNWRRGVIQSALSSLFHQF